MRTPPPLVDFGWPDGRVLDNARCRPQDAALFTDPDPIYVVSSETGKVTHHPDWAPAAAICLTCPVRPACLDWALAVGVGVAGFVGGLTPDERAGAAGPR